MIEGLILYFSTQTPERISLNPTLLMDPQNFNRSTSAVLEGIFEEEELANE
jgi:hypothetical protein